jgi:hypothetical protein
MLSDMTLGSRTGAAKSFSGEALTLGLGVVPRPRLLFDVVMDRSTNFLGALVVDFARWPGLGNEADFTTTGD